MYEQKSINPGWWRNFCWSLFSPISDYPPFKTFPLVKSRKEFSRRYKLWLVHDPEIKHVIEMTVFVIDKFIDVTEVSLNFL